MHRKLRYSIDFEESVTHTHTHTCAKTETGLPRLSVTSCESKHRYPSFHRIATAIIESVLIRYNVCDNNLYSMVCIKTSVFEYAVISFRFICRPIEFRGFFSSIQLTIIF